MDAGGRTSLGLWLRLRARGMTTEAGTRELGGSRRKEGHYPVADEDWQDGVTVAAPRFARVVTHSDLRGRPRRRQEEVFEAWDERRNEKTDDVHLLVSRNCQDSARRDGDSTGR